MTKPKAKIIWIVFNYTTHVNKLLINIAKHHKR